MHNTINLIATDSLWIESKAVIQMEAIAQLKGVTHVTGLPDLHPGRGIPVGCVTISSNMLYPHIIGNDIGCGMALFRTKTIKDKFSLSKVMRKLKKSLGKNKNGSIGGGNHFAELLFAEDVYRVEKDEKIKKGELFLLIHSGSRGLGSLVYEKYIKEHNAQNGISLDSAVFRSYMKDHNKAAEFARENRLNIAQDFSSISGIKIDMEPFCESMHNYVEIIDVDGKQLIIHRKGASPAMTENAVIPGSRGDYTYIVRPKNSSILNGFSLPHGAGRKWARSECKSRLSNRYKKEDMIKSRLNSIALYTDKDRLYTEAPEAYKNIEDVLKALEQKNLIERAVKLKPLITMKE